MTDTTQYDLVKSAREWREYGSSSDPFCMADHFIDAMADRIEELEANINLKADFIHATINQLANSDQRIEELEAKLAMFEAMSMQDFSNYLTRKYMATLAAIKEKTE